MGWLRRLAGEGKIKVEITFSDGSKGSAKIPYEGDLSTLDKNELVEYVKNYCLVEYDMVATIVKIVGAY